MMEDTVVTVITSTLKSLALRQILFKVQTIKYVWKTATAISLNKDCHSFRKPGHCLFYLMCVASLAMDSFLGTSVAIVLYQNPNYTSLVSHSVSRWTLFNVDMVSTSVQWLMGVPGGLKLNNELDWFMGTCFLYMTKLWRELYKEIIEAYSEHWLHAILVISPFGLTLMLSLIHDILKFAMMCITCLYIISAKLYSYQVSALMSLARLFMGRKYNVLKNRIDSCDYDASQLLLGTVLFTILLFLLPTTSMYYFIMLLLKLVSSSVQLSSKVLMILINKAYLVIPKTLAFLKSRHLPEVELQQGKCIWRGDILNLRGFKDQLDAIPNSELINEYCKDSAACEDYIRLVQPSMIYVVPSSLSNFVLAVVLAMMKGSVLSL